MSLNVFATYVQALRKYPEQGRQVTAAQSRSVAVPTADPLASEAISLPSSPVLAAYTIWDVFLLGFQLCLAPSTLRQANRSSADVMDGRTAGDGGTAAEDALVPGVAAVPRFRSRKRRSLRVRATSAQDAAACAQARAQHAPDESNVHGLVGVHHNLDALLTATRSAARDA
jgi:hypothetical protein